MACERNKSTTTDCIVVTIATLNCPIDDLRAEIAAGLQEAKEFVGKECDLDTSVMPGAVIISGCKCKKKSEREGVPGSLETSFELFQGAVGTLRTALGTAATAGDAAGLMPGLVDSLEGAVSAAVRDSRRAVDAMASGERAELTDRLDSFALQADLMTVAALQRPGGELVEAIKGVIMKAKQLLPIPQKWKVIIDLLLEIIDVLLGPDLPGSVA